MKIALAIIFPPLGVLACGKFGQFLLNIFFCIIGVWIGGIIHAVYVVMKHDQDERHREMILALQASPPAYQPLPSNGERVETPKKGGPSAALVGFGVLLLLMVIITVISSLFNLPDAGKVEVVKTQVANSSEKSLTQYYSIISDKPTGTVKRAVDVRLKEKVSEETIKRIATEIRASNRKRFERTFIIYYLPDQIVGAGGWATSHFNPSLEVDILGLPKDSEAVSATVAKSGETEIGRWEYPAPSGFIAVVLKSDAGFTLRRTFGDGSSLVERITASLNGTEIFLLPVEKSDTGDYWILDADGNFRLMDNDGFIGKALISGVKKEVEQMKELLGLKEGKSNESVATIFDQRTWTSADGQRTFVGKLTTIGEGQVTVERDGEDITFPIATLSEADRRFLGQGVTIATVDGKTHENGSVMQITAEVIFFKTPLGLVRIPMENLPEKMRQHFAYDPKKAAEAQRARDQQAATMRSSEVSQPATGSTSVRKDAERLYMELREMRYNPEFHAKGFGEGGSFRQWYLELEALKKKAPLDPELLTLDLLVGELYTVAVEWMRSKGQDTEASLFFSSKWDRACGIESN